MVPLNTISCGHNVYVSAQSVKHYSCCVRTSLVGFLGLSPHCGNFFRTRDVNLVCSFQAASFLVARCREGRGGGWEAWSGGNDRISVGWHSVIRKDHPLVGIHISIFVLARTRKKPKRAAFITIHQQLDRWSRPRWSHTWRYTPLPVTPYHEYMYWPPSKW